MVIHTLPPRRMCRVIAIRADSICRLDTYACSSAWMPYSPKATRVPPLAAPCRSGRCCLRCLTLRGISMTQPSSPLVAAGAASAGAAGLAWLAGAWSAPPRSGRSPPGARTPPPLRPGRPVPALAGPQSGRGRLALGPGLRSFAAIDPDLHADPAERGPGLVEAVVDVRAQRVQRHPALAVELGPGHLRAAEAAGALHPDALGARALHRGLHGLAHRPAEGHPAGQLLGHALRDELRVRLRVLHLEDVQLDLLAGQLLQVTADPVGLGAAAADDDARPGGVDVHPDPVPGALDLA